MWSLRAAMPAVHALRHGCRRGAPLSGWPGLAEEEAAASASQLPRPRPHGAAPLASGLALSVVGVEFASPAPQPMAVAGVDAEVIISMMGCCKLSEVGAEWVGALASRVARAPQQQWGILPAPREVGRCASESCESRVHVGQALRLLRALVATGVHDFWSQAPPGAWLGIPALEW